MNTTSNLQYEDEIDLQRYRRFLSSHWILLLLSAIGGASIAVAASSLIPPRFQSTATLLVQPGGAAPIVLTPTTAKALLVNPTVVSETINEVGLNRDGVTTQHFIDDALDVQPIAGTNLVSLSVALSDPTKARLAAALLARKVIDLSERVDRETPSASRAVLEKQLTEADRNLKDAEERLFKFQASADLDSLQAETTSKVSRRADVDAIAISLESERARLATLEQELARQPMELSAPMPRGAATEQFRARQNAAGAVETNPLANPVYTMLQYDIAQSRATISRLERQQRQTLAMTSGAAMTSQRAELYRRRLELARLQAEYEARTRMYNAVVSRSEEPTASTASTPQLQILAGPVQPDQPMPRRRRQFATLGGLIGLVCGIVVALVIDGRKVAHPTTV